MPTNCCVSGLYFAHPEAKYPHAPLNKDQFEECLEHKGQPLEETERWIAPNYGY